MHTANWQCQQVRHIEVHHKTAVPVGNDAGGGETATTVLQPQIEPAAQLSCSMGTAPKCSTNSSRSFGTK